MAEAQATTLILVTNTVAGRQWKRELLARTSLTEEEIGEYSGERKEIRPVTIATYQVMTTRRKGEYRHLELFDSRDWGLIVYDEVHLLPAPIFRLTADLQSRRRLGLTATLVREDGREGDVFSPDRPEAVRRAVEGHRDAGLDRPGRLHRGAGDAHRRRADGLRDRRAGGPVQDRRDRPDQAAGGPGASSTSTRTTRCWSSAPTSTSSTTLGEELDAPIIQGSTTNRGAGAAVTTRSGSGEISALVVVQGRQLLHRPARGGGRDPGLRHVRLPPGGGAAARPGAAAQGRRRQAHFYTVVARDTLDPDYAAHRQRFLAEQGYAYTIVDADDLLAAG